MSGQVLAEICQAYDLMEQFASWAQLEDDVVVLPRFGEVDELDNVGVIKLSHDLYFFEDICSL